MVQPLKTLAELKKQWSDEQSSSQNNRFMEELNSDIRLHPGFTLFSENMLRTFVFRSICYYDN